MTALSKYLAAIIAEVNSATAEKVEGHNLELGTYPNDENRNAKVAATCRLRSIEFTIPLALEQTKPKESCFFKKQTLNRRVFAAVCEVMHLDRFPENQFFRLRNLLEIESKKLDLLLVQENILVDRALKDYAQRLIAIAYDEYREAEKETGAEPSQGSAATDFSLEGATNRLTSMLLPEIEEATLEGAGAVAIKVVSENLHDYPPRLLTYVKLLISEN
ncbi:MAG TPA: hypothetical protein ENJ82_02585 [Bacteroidetes bacterium]|nr:hypothetical protein [Bacteroidota bacterium]